MAEEKKEKKKKKIEGPLYIFYGVTMRIKDRIVGGIPKNPAVIAQWIKTAMDKANKVKTEEIIKETVELMGADEYAEKAWTGFKSHPEHGLFIEGRQVKAMFKEGANVIKKRIDIKNFRAKLAERMWVMEDMIPLGVKEPTGFDERPVHVMTRQGPRSALKRFDYVEKPEINFEIRVWNDGVITEDLLTVLIDYCAFNGLGAMRSQGEGVSESWSMREIAKSKEFQTLRTYPDH